MKKALAQEIESPKMLIMVALFLFLPLGFRPSFELFGATVRLSQLAGIALIIITAPQIYKSRLDWLRTPWIFISGFMIVSVLSSMFALSRGEAFITSAFYGFAFLLAYAVSKSFELKNSAAYKVIIYISGVSVALFCVYQFVADSLGASSTYTLLLAPYTKEIFGFPRIQGFSLEPLHLANYLLIPYSLAISEYLISAKKSRLVLATAFLSTIILTVARGAYLAVGAVLIISIATLLLKRQWGRILGLVCSVLLAGTLAVTLITGSGLVAGRQMAKTIVPENSRPNLPTQEVSVEGNATRLIYHVDSFGSDLSYLDRIKTIEKALELGASKPLLGVGPGNFGPYVVANEPGSYGDPAQVVNNEPAEIFAETGVVGLALMLLFITWLVRAVIKYRKKQSSVESKIWLYACSLMILGFVVQWQTFSTLYITHIWVMIGVLLSIVLDGSKREGVDEKSKKLRQTKSKS